MTAQKPTAGEVKIRRRSGPLLAWQFVGQPQNQWPAWPGLKTAMVDGHGNLQGRHYTPWQCKYGGWLVVTEDEREPHPTDSASFHQIYEPYLEAAEAFDIFHQTGLSPRELAEQREELLAALKECADRLDGARKELLLLNEEDDEQSKNADKADSEAVATARAVLAKFARPHDDGTAVQTDGEPWS
jgi:hypothetical protein